MRLQLSWIEQLPSKQWVTRSSRVRRTTFMKIIYILQIFLDAPEIHYACMDQHIDATFRTQAEAQAYADYFKPYHNYQIIPFASF